MARDVFVKNILLQDILGSLKWVEYQNGKFIFCAWKIFLPVEFSHIFQVYF